MNKLAKKVYRSPALLELTPDEDPTIVIGGSQGSSGYDTPYTFSGISDDDMAMIDLNCDDFDLQDMDADGNYNITADEFNAWLANRGGW